jgi:hypothetical protein
VGGGLGGEVAKRQRLTGCVRVLVVIAIAAVVEVVVFVIIIVIIVMIVILIASVLPASAIVPPL